jgi:hypothetical protein
VKRVSDSQQRAGVWTTPHGPNVRYTVRFHIVGFDTEDGGLRPATGHRDVRFITPLGSLRAVALAAVWLSQAEPGLRFGEVELACEEEDFAAERGDLQDDASRAR